MEYKEVQKIAKDTIEYAKKNIYAGMSLIEIREMCERKMLEFFENLTLLCGFVRIKLVSKVVTRYRMWKKWR